MRSQSAGITWTAPAAGTVTLDVTYEATQASPNNYAVSDPESEVFQNSTVVSPLTAMTSYQATSIITNVLTVAQGDVLTFMGVQTNPGGINADGSNCSISGTIDFAPVPEPSSAVLLVCGMAGLLTYAWRKRRR
jgi:hypothetical protein